MNNNKRLIVLSSPSGGGKTTVAKFILSKYPNARFSVSATTRPPREGEINGQNYHFMTHEIFQDKINNGEFVEFEKIFDNYYGTLKSEIQNAIDADEILLFDVDVKGALSLKKAFPDNSLLIFLAPPSRQILEERLRNRQTETEEQIKKRLDRADMELSRTESFDYVIVNNILDETLKSVANILNSAL